MYKPAWRKNGTRLPGASTKPYTLWKAHGFLRKEWMFSLNCFNPHHPFDPPAEYLERYLNRLDEIPLPNYEEGELNNKPVFQQKDHEGAYDTKDYYAYEKHPPQATGHLTLAAVAKWTHERIRLARCPQKYREQSLESETSAWETGRHKAGRS